MDKSNPISRKTKISDLIKADNRVIEAMVEVDAHFTKLRNPLLRTVLAPRVTIEDAARIAGCDVNAILKKMESLGFVTGKPDSESGNNNTVIPEQILAAIKASKIITLDVRPSLEKGIDPFSIIMDQIKVLPADYALEIVNSFEPVPLIRILSGKKYRTHTENTGGVFHCYFIAADDVLNSSTASRPQPEFLKAVSESEMESLRKEYGASDEIDVRNLEMPEPMVQILEKLSELNGRASLFVHHKKIPQFLLPELRTRGYRIYALEKSESDVQLLIVPQHATGSKQ